MFPLMICTTKSNLSAHFEEHSNYTCDILLGNKHNGVIMFFCQMSHSVWQGIMLNVFNALHRDRVYVYPPEEINEWRKSEVMVMLGRRSKLRYFSPPLYRKRCTCFR